MAIEDLSGLTVRQSTVPEHSWRTGAETDIAQMGTSLCLLWIWASSALVLTFKKNESTFMFVQKHKSGQEELFKERRREDLINFRLLLRSIPEIYYFGI